MAVIDVDVKVCKLSEKYIVSTRELCEILGVSRQTLINWLERGCPQMARGTWNLKDVIEWRKEKPVQEKRKYVPKLVYTNKATVIQKVRALMANYRANYSEKITKISEEFENECMRYGLDDAELTRVLNSYQNAMDDVKNTMNEEFKKILKSVSPKRKREEWGQIIK